MSRRTFFCIDAHPAGNPVRVVVGGAPPLTGATMSDRRQHFIRDYDWIRTGLMLEPRGHDVMSGAVLYAPTRDDADAALVFIDTRGVRFLDAGTVIRSSSVDGFHLDPDALLALGSAIAAAVATLPEVAT